MLWYVASISRSEIVEANTAQGAINNSDMKAISLVRLATNYDITSHDEHLKNILMEFTTKVHKFGVNSKEVSSFLKNNSGNTEFVKLAEAASLLVKAFATCRND